MKFIVVLFIFAIVLSLNSAQAALFECSPNLKQAVGEAAIAVVSFNIGAITDINSVVAALNGVSSQLPSGGLGDSIKILQSLPDIDHQITSLRILYPVIVKLCIG